MAYYLFQAAYTAEGWTAQIKNPQDVRERVQAAMEKFGGKIVGAWYAFGEHDLVAVLEYPSNVDAAAYVLAALSGAGSTIKTIRTTPLMTIEEGLEAMKKAAEAGGLYRPPGS